MTRERMIVYMDLLDDTFIEEASPENTKDRKRKQFPAKPALTRLVSSLPAA